MGGGSHGHSHCSGRTDPDRFRKLGLPGRGVSNDFVRAELGLERLEARWAKLRMGYWHKLVVSKPERAVAKVVAWRRRRLPPEGYNNLQLGTGWLQTSKLMFEKYGLTRQWEAQDSGRVKERWRDLCYTAVEEAEDREARTRLKELVTMQRYEARLKDWGKTLQGYAAYAGERDRRGSRVVERYLDAWSEPVGPDSRCSAGANSYRCWPA